VWVVDDTIADTLFRRIERFLPENFPYGAAGKLASLGRRFRFYKYTPGAEYKPHIDGAWPGSGVDDEV
jgi:hypothetical protein